MTSYFNRVGQVNLRVRDLKKSIAWYTEVLGLKLVADYDDTVLLNFNGVDGDYEYGMENEAIICLIALNEDEDDVINKENGTYPVLVLSAASAEVCKSDLEARGIWVEGSKGHFKFKDLDGNVLEAYLPGLYENSEFKHLR